jgi:hypothetical protein
MIKKHELRIGNWVLFHRRYIQIQNLGNSLANESVRTKGTEIVSFDGAHYNYLDPVPITPELLEFIEFVLPSKQGFFTRVQNGVVKCKLDGSYFIVLIGEVEFSHIQSLHQLQNLYFALTGEDLTIDL